MDDETSRLKAVIAEMRDALLANQVFHTPLALRKNGNPWDEYQMDAITRTHNALTAASHVPDTAE